MGRSGGTGEPGDQPLSTSPASSHHIPASLLTAQKFLPVLSTHRAFITAHAHHYFCLEHSFLQIPSFPLISAGLTLEVSSPGSPPPPSAPSNEIQTPDCAVLQASCSLPPPSLLEAAALLPAVPSQGWTQSTVLSPEAHTPRPALSAFSISTCQMNRCITHTNKNPLPWCRGVTLHQPGVPPGNLLVH